MLKSQGRNVLEGADHLDGLPAPVGQPRTIGLAELTLVEEGPGGPWRAREGSPDFARMAVLDERRSQLDATRGVEALSESNPLRDKAVIGGDLAQVAIMVATDLEETIGVLDSPHATRMGTKNVSANQSTTRRRSQPQQILSIAGERTTP